jgi:3-methyladenine DNA glycosylase AlkC
MTAFKDEFSTHTITLISAALHRAAPSHFDPLLFADGLADLLPPLELKARVLLFADHIARALPLPPPQLFPILTGALSSGDDDPVGLTGWPVWPLTELVARHGLDHLPESFAALARMTPHFSAEFAIRPFLANHTRQALDQLFDWSAHPDHHLRRLASEGARPYLPWGASLPLLAADPSLTLPILESLHLDPSPYVRRSVANHLNDHARAQPDFVIATLKRWLAASPSSTDLPRLARHALRTLIKKGHPDALALLGFAPASCLELVDASLPLSHITLGDHLPWQLTIQNLSPAPARSVVDYAIHFRRKDGTLSRKVFKGRTLTLAPGQRLTLDGRHHFRPITTRTHYPGQHAFEPLLNGAPTPPLPFHLALAENFAQETP